jgi:glutamyl-tRNA(Gln) amidotransferase subunit D
MHSSYRSTFRTIGDIPIATVSREKVTPLREDYIRRRNDNNVKVNAVFDDRVAIVYYYPNMKPDMIDSLIDNGYKGIVIQEPTRTR